MIIIWPHAVVNNINPLCMTMHHIILQPWRSTSQVFFSCQELINLLFPGRGYSLKCKGMAKIMREFIRISISVDFVVGLFQLICVNIVKSITNDMYTYTLFWQTPWPQIYIYIVCILHMSFRQNAQKYWWNPHKCHFMQIWFRTFFLLAELWWTFRPMGLMHFL